MKKNLAVTTIPSKITEEITRIHWTYNLNIDVPVKVGEIIVEGNRLHEKLRRTLLNSKYYNQKRNSLVVSFSFVASSGSSARVFQIPLVVNFNNKNYKECYTDSAPYEVDELIIYNHINQRANVAKDFMGLSLPEDYMPEDLNEFLWRTFHSEQALIEYLFKSRSLDNLMSSMLNLGIKDYNHIEAVVLDIHSKYYVCEFCEVSLFGLQDPKHPKGWLKSALEPALKKGGFTFSASEIAMNTRISADIAFPRLTQKAIMPNQEKLVSNNLGYFNNQVILAKDMSRFKILDGDKFSSFSVFRSGSLFTRNNETFSKQTKPEKRKWGS